jgi:hypothetical protein
LEECDVLDLRRLEGQYLIFIAETHTELNMLEHLETCIPCRKRVIFNLRKGEENEEWGGLLKWDIGDSSAPIYRKYDNAEDFLEARIRWRKGILLKLLESAEVEVESLKDNLKF